MLLVQLYIIVVEVLVKHRHVDSRQMHNDMHESLLRHLSTTKTTENKIEKVLGFSKTVLTSKSS